MNDKRPEDLRVAVWPIFVSISLVTTGRGAVSIIFTPFLKINGFSLANIGSMVALFSIFSLISRLPSGTLYSYRRSRWLYSCSTLMFALSIMGFPGAGRFTALAAGVFGFSYGMVTTFSLALLMDVSKGRDTAKLAGGYSAFIAAGFFFGHFCAGFLVDHLGYQMSFFLLGCLQVASLGTFLFLPFDPEVKTPVATKPAVKDIKTSWLCKLKSFRNLNPTVYLGALLGFYLNFMDGAISSFFPIYAVGVGISMTMTGVTSSVKGMAAAVARILSPFILKQKNYRKINNVLMVLTIGVMFSIPFFVMIPVLMLLFTISGMARGLVRVTSMAYTMQEGKAGGEDKGMASALYNSGLDTGRFVGPVVAGVIAEKVGVASMFKLLSVFMLFIYTFFMVWEVRMRSRQVQPA